MRIKIIKSAKTTYWYNNLIGHEFQARKADWSFDNDEGPEKGDVELTRKSLKDALLLLPKEEREFVSGLTVSNGDYEIVKISKLEK